MLQAAGAVSHLHWELFTLKVITCHGHFSPPEDGDGYSLRSVVFLTHLNVGHVRNMFKFILKECHPRCAYQIYNRLIMNNDSQKHNYICKYNNLPTTCFGLIRPSSGWNTASEENYLFDLNVSGMGGGRDLVYKYGDSG